MKLSILFLALLSSRIAWGFDCEYKMPPFFENVDKADVILSGVVVEVAKDESSRVATVRIKDVIKSGDSLKVKDEIKVSFLKPLNPDRDDFDCGKESGKTLNLKKGWDYLFFLEKRPSGYSSSMDAGTTLSSIAAISKYDEVIRKYLAGSKKEDLYPLLPKGDRPE